MTRELGQAARRILASKPGEGNSSKQVAERASHACEQLTLHLTRLLGKTGVEMVLERSVVLASAALPWLAEASTIAALRGVMEHQEPAAITEAFVAILSAQLGLLDRLIGEGLVERLLYEVWPSVFVPEAKDTP